MSPGLKTTSGKPKHKNEPLYLDGGDPDVCLTVRLLPPKLGPDDFLNQAKAHSEAFNARSIGLSYEQGTREVKPFEKPTFSVAHVQFASAQLAAQAKEQLDGKIFHEPETDDNMSCQCIKSLVGRVYVSPVADASKVSHGSQFHAFSKLREEKGGHVLLRELLDDSKQQLRSRRKRKKKAEGTATKVDVDQAEAARKPATEGPGKKTKAPKKSNNAEKEKIEAGLKALGPEGSKKKRKKKEKAGKATGAKQESNTKDTSENANSKSNDDNQISNSKAISNSNTSSISKLKMESTEASSAKRKRQSKKKTKPKSGSDVAQPSEMPAPPST